jgi:hypothetical protein
MATIDVTVPTITFTAINAWQQVDVTVPTITFTKIDVVVYAPIKVNATVPEITFTAIDADVTRENWYKLPWLVDQCKIYIEDGAGVQTLADYTKRGTHWIELDSALGASEKLYVNPGAVRPFVLGRVGDYILTQYGAHRISAVPNAYELELEWYPPVACSGTYVPAQEMPAGGAEGDGKLIVGLGRGFDRIMLQILVLPHENADATGAKITELELGYRPTGPELKTDAGG